MKLKTMIQSVSLLVVCTVGNLAQASDLHYHAPQTVRTVVRPQAVRLAMPLHVNQPLQEPGGPSAARVPGLPQPAARAGAAAAPAVAAAPQAPNYAARHHWRPVIVNINIYTRPQVVLVEQMWLREPALQAEAETLRAAYAALSRANLDYDGHRYGAMRETAISGNFLGVYLRGDSSGDESVDASNAQMGVARELLGQVYDGLMAKGYPDIAGHVDNAIQQVSAGLSDD
jgi:hypothetical protein